MKLPSWVRSVLFSLLYVLTWQHPGLGVHPLAAGGHGVLHAVSDASLILFRSTGTGGPPADPRFVWSERKWLQPSRVFHGGVWNMPGQDKHSHCGLFNVAFCQPSRGRCIGFTPLSAFFLSNVYQELWKRMGVPGRGEKNEVLKGRFLWCRGARGDWIPSSSQMRMLPWFPGDMWRLSLVSCCPPVIITKLWHFLFWFGQFWGWFVSPGSTCRP